MVCAGTDVLEEFNAERRLAGDLPEFLVFYFCFPPAHYGKQHSMTV